LLKKKQEKKLMAAYFIVDVTVEDPETYETYRKLVKPTLDLYGGTFLARGGVTETIEGNWQPGRLVIIEFANTEAFKRWYDSPEYSNARAIRFSASTSRAVLLQGI
jgi:uncharacterized protein (DUF1330 family)